MGSSDSEDEAKAALLADETTSSSSKKMILRIKSSYQDTEIEIQKGCPQTTSVAQLKILVRNALLQKEAEEQHETSTNLRLVCKGRLLSPDESPLSDFKVANNDVVHAVLSKAASMAGSMPTAKKESTGSSSTSQQQQQQQQQQFLRSSLESGRSIPQLLQHQRRRRQRPNRGIGTIIGSGGRVTRAPNNNSNHDSSNSEDDDDEDFMDLLERGATPTSRTTRRRGERRGFDLLRGPLSRQEITAIRTYFSRHVDRYIQQQQQLQQQQENNNGQSGGDSTPPSTLHLDEPDLMRRRLLLEEEWMRSQGPTSEFRLNLNQNTLLRLNNNTIANNTGNSRTNGNTANTPVGTDREFFCGFALGFCLGILALMWIWIPAVPHKQKLGIMTGICCSVVMEQAGSSKLDNQDSEYYGAQDQLIFDGGGLRGGR